MDTLAELSKVGALVTDSHIIYTSGKHGSAYVNKDAVYPHTDLTRQVAKAMAALVPGGESVEVVLAPAIGAVILGQLIADELGRLQGQAVLSVYAEKASNSEEFLIKRGYDRLIQGRRVMVVEDIVNTGGSLLRTIHAARKVGAQVVGAVALCNRGGVTATDLDQIPWLKSLITVNLEAWDPKDCPLCAKGVPINTSLGKGKSL